MARQTGRKRHVPQRTCIACRRTDSKRGLVRVVRNKEQGVVIDPTGKLAGRGAYLCASRSCWEKAFKSNALNRALKTVLNEEETVLLKAYGSQLPEVAENSSDEEATDLSERIA